MKVLLYRKKRVIFKYTEQIIDIVLSKNGTSEDLHWKNSNYIVLFRVEDSRRNSRNIFITGTELNRLTVYL